MTDRTYNAIGQLSLSYSGLLSSVHKSPFHFRTIPSAPLQHSHLQWQAEIKLDWASCTKNQEPAER